MGSILHKERKVFATFVLTLVFFVVIIRSLGKTNYKWYVVIFFQNLLTFIRLHKHSNANLS